MQRAKFKDGIFRCPKCNGILMKLYYGGCVHGGEIKCHRCKTVSVLEKDKNE